jgi:adenine phosphoribosyltransferase
MISLAKRVEEKLLVVPDFPKPGIQFRDITPVLLEPWLFTDIVDWMSNIANYRHPNPTTSICGIESRGFIFASAVAHEIKKPLVLFRKPGKLPRHTKLAVFEKEYGPDELHMHSDSIKPGQTVWVIDDVLATGGTALAAKQIVEELSGATAKFIFLAELKALRGREKLGKSEVRSLVQI